mmetsp:Transcript_32313/g.73876  ORF Transcript_32313/g.73876 Transcript_32313/m.73876 type:complete len:231 (-) Transcript_32313:184-876(-)
MSPSSCRSILSTELSSRPRASLIRSVIPRFPTFREAVEKTRCVKAFPKLLESVPAWLVGSGSLCEDPSFSRLFIHGHAGGMNTRLVGCDSKASVSSCFRRAFTAALYLVQAGLTLFVNLSTGTVEAWRAAMTAKPMAITRYNSVLPRQIMYAFATKSTVASGSSPSTINSPASSKISVSTRIQLFNVVRWADARSLMSSLCIEHSEIFSWSFQYLRSCLISMSVMKASRL